MTRREAEQHMARHADHTVVKSRKVVAPLAVVLASGDEVLTTMINRVWMKERRFPLIYLMRCERHLGMKLHLFGWVKLIM